MAQRLVEAEAAADEQRALAGRIAICSEQSVMEEARRRCQHLRLPHVEKKI
jgi:hypothetical protein